jgi:tetratricopeptide (TPR) repeat protein
MSIRSRSPGATGRGAVDWAVMEAHATARSNGRAGSGGGTTRRPDPGPEAGESMDSLLATALQEMQRLLKEGDAKGSLEGGLRTLRLAEAYWGSRDLRLVPLYLHLNHASQGVLRWKQAEDFLGAAQWVLLRDQKAAPLPLRAAVARAFGRLYLATRRTDAALKHAAHAVYHLSVVHGLDHVETALGYYDLGDAFSQKGNPDCAGGFYTKAAAIWRRFLTGACGPPDGNATAASPAELLGADTVAAAREMLPRVAALLTDRFGELHPTTGQATMAAGMFFVWTRERSLATPFLTRSLQILQGVYGPQHPETLSVVDFIDRHPVDIPESEKET